MADNLTEAKTAVGEGYADRATAHALVSIAEDLRRIADQMEARR